MMLKNKLGTLEGILKKYDYITVALSGGVDSAFLLAFACKVLGSGKVRALTASGPHLAADEVEYAKALCAALGVAHDIIDMTHIMPILAPNPADRCYHCKKAMFSELLRKTAAYSDSTGSDENSGCTYTLADGTNLDDMNDYRPGHKALAELQIASPLKDAGLTKNEIRAALEGMVFGAENEQSGSAGTCTLANALMLPDGTPIWDKPAFACLASRIPYGETITENKLSMVYEAETFLRSLGLKQVRVRHHGDIARIEVSAGELVKLFHQQPDEQLTGQLDIHPDKSIKTIPDMINDHLKSLGFKYVTLDLGGYKMGGGFHNGQETR